MPVTSTHHGLSTHTTNDMAADADTTDNRRLHRPVPQTIALNNAFNDATSGRFYDQRFGHEGLDYVTGPTDVKAMYGGVVVKVVNDWLVGGTESAGNYVTIRSCTDPAIGVGFEHTYLHLQEDSKILEAMPGWVEAGARAAGAGRGLAPRGTPQTG